MVRHRKPASSYHHGDLRDALLAEALKFIERHELEELSIRYLARKLGVSTAAPYHHFANRMELLRALAARLFEQLEIDMRKERDLAGRDPFDRLRAIGRVYVRCAARHPSHFRLMFHRYWAGGFDAGPGNNAFEVLREAVADCLKEAGKGGDDPSAAILAMWGGAHGIAAICFDGPLAVLAGPNEIDALCDRALGIIAGALKQTSTR